MNKLISVILSILMFFSLCFAQTKPYGYKALGNGSILSNSIFIQDGFVLDSIAEIFFTPSKTYHFEYDDKGKLTRDINFNGSSRREYDTVSRRYRITKLPGTRDYYYNERGEVDSMVYGHFTLDTTIWTNDSVVDKFKYSDNGRILSHTQLSSGLLLSFTNNSYDIMGNLILQQEGRSQALGSGFFDTTTYFFEYDLLGRMVFTKTIKSNETYHYQNCSYYYDSTGNISWISRNISFQPHDSDVFNERYCLRFDETDKTVDGKYWSEWKDTATTYPPWNFKFNYDQYNKVSNVSDISDLISFRYNSEENLDTLILFYPVAVYSGITLIDSYGNSIVPPPDTRWYRFYYSRLSGTPPSEPTIYISCTSLNFGNIVKDSVKPVSFQITNTSLNTLVIDSIYTHTSHFAPDVKNAEVDQSSPYTLTVQFKPGTFGFYSDTLFLRNNSSKGLVKIPVAGKSPQPFLKVSPASLEFGQVSKDSIYQKGVFLTDSSVNTLQIDSIYTVTKYFTIVQNLTNNIINKNDTGYITIGFAPDSAGTFYDTLFIFNNSPGSPMKVSLAGNTLLTSVLKNDEIPHSFAVFQNYPNPFNPTTTIAFSLPTKSSVSLTIFDILGRTVSEIINNETLSAGNYSKQWNASGLSSGVYFYRLQAGTFTETKKLILLR